MRLSAQRAFLAEGFFLRCHNAPVIHSEANMQRRTIALLSVALIAAPGIGKKIAQRIILELKDKLTKEQQLDVISRTFHQGAVVD